jgi:single-strand DNA-binding protein
MTSGMRGLNKVMLIGNLGADSVLWDLEGNVRVAKFSLATSESYRDDKGVLQTKTDWHTVLVWRALADLAERYLRKGSQVYIEGKMCTRDDMDKAGTRRYVTEVVGQRITILDKKE